MITDGGPWRGPTTAQWIRRISPWPVPWVRREKRPPELSELEKRYLWGDR